MLPPPRPSSSSSDVGGVHRSVFLDVHICLLLLGVPRQVRMVHVPGGGLVLLAENDPLQARRDVHPERVCRGKG